MSFPIPCIIHLCRPKIQTMSVGAFICTILSGTFGECRTCNQNFPAAVPVVLCLAKQIHSYKHQASAKDNTCLCIWHCKHHRFPWKIKPRRWIIRITIRFYHCLECCIRKGAKMPELVGRSKHIVPNRCLNVCGGAHRFIHQHQWIPKWYACPGKVTRLNPAISCLPTRSSMMIPLQLNITNANAITR